jgi:hypothetical protein
MGVSVATDYDKPRATDNMNEPAAEPSLRALTTQRADAATKLGDDTDPVETRLDLPELDPTAEELTVPLLPRQDDEFTCTVCYLVRHHSQLADERRMVCDECAGWS